METKSKLFILLSQLFLFCISVVRADFSVLNKPEGGEGTNSSEGTVETNSISNDTSANSTQPLPSLSLPQCTELDGNEGWISLTGPIEVKDCVQTLVKIKSAAAGKENDSYLFYSQQVYPNGPPAPDEQTPWKLPIGAETTFNDGNCVGVVRMRRDFAQGVLPLENGQYLPVGGPPTQLANWSSLITEFENLITKCVSGSLPRRSGWGLVGDIVVSMWARNSQIDQLYGFYVSGVPSRVANETTFNVTGTGPGAGEVLLPNGGEVSGAALSVSITSVAGAPYATAAFSYGNGDGEDTGGGVNGHVGS